MTEKEILKLSKQFWTVNRYGSFFNVLGFAKALHKVMIEEDYKNSKKSIDALQSSNQLELWESWSEI